MDYFATLFSARKTKKSPTKKTSPTSPGYKALNMKFEGNALRTQLRSIKKKRKSPKVKSPEINVAAIKKARANYELAVKKQSAAEKNVKVATPNLKKLDKNKKNEKKVVAKKTNSKISSLKLKDSK